jgi:hypothetical protein
MAILDLISQVHLPSSANKLPKYLKHFTFSSEVNIWAVEKVKRYFNDESNIFEGKKSALIPGIRRSTLYAMW